MGLLDRRSLLAALMLCLQARPAAGRPDTAAPRRAQASARPAQGVPLIILDPGHGGADPGAIGPGGTQEKRLTLAIALELKRQLERQGRVRVALTRTRDVFVPLARRVDIAREREAALLLSIHADALPPGQPSVRGASVYTLAETATDPLAAALARQENLADRAGGLRLPSVSPEVQRILLSLMRHETRAGSERLARLAVSALEGDVPLLGQPLRQARFVVLKAPDVPSALVECGFLSHPQEEAALRRADHRARVAASLAEAIGAFVGGRASS